MQRFLVSLLLLSALGVAQAQTIKITTANGPCTYPTGTVTSDPSTPGQLLATVPTGQTPTGAGCGSSSTNAPVSYGPASVLTATSSTTIGPSAGTVNFTYQPLNATSCTGTITPSTGTSFTTTFCSNAGACAPLQNVTASFPANGGTANQTYSVSVSCTGPGSVTPVTSTVTPITVSFTQVQGTCPIQTGSGAITAFSQYAGTHSVNYYGAPSKSADVTSFDALYGTWPGNSAITPVISLGTSLYLAEKFTVPAGYMAGYTGSTALYGSYPLNSSGGATPTSMTISSVCGDFSNPTKSGSSVVTGCWVNKHTSTTPGPLQWRKDTTCILQDGHTYYLNIINADITNAQPNGGGTVTTTKDSHCSATACTVPVNNGGSFTNYNFP
jgi:hypothetical protein